MRMGMLTLTYMYILFWVGCYSTPELHKLGSKENLLREATYSTQVSRASARRLLGEEASANSDTSKEETANVTADAVTETKSEAVTDTKSVVEEDTIVEKADVEGPGRESAAVDAKKEEVKVDPAPATHENVAKAEELKNNALQEAAKEEQSQEQTKGDGVEQKDAQTAETEEAEKKEEEVKVDPAPATHENAAKAEEPKSNALQEAAKEEQSQEQTKGDEVEQKDAHTAETEEAEKEKETMEVIEKEPLTTKEDHGKEEVETEKIAQVTDENHSKEEAQKEKDVQEPSMQSRDEADSVPAREEPGEDASIEQVPDKVVDLVEPKDVPDVDTQGKDAPGNVTESAKEDGLHVDLTVSEKHNDASDKVHVTSNEARITEGKQQDNPTEGNRDLGEKTGAVVETVRLEGSDENAKASVDKVDGPNNSTGVSADVSSDAKTEDEGVEDKPSASPETKEEGSEDGTQVPEVQDIEIREERSGNGTKELLRVQDDRVEEKTQELSNDSGNGTSEDKDLERNEEKNESDGGSTDTRHDGSEDSDVKDVSLVAASDAETEAATKEVEMQLEALKRDSVMETTVEQAHERDPSEDEYDIIQEITDLPTKFQETAGKVAQHLRPDVIKWKDASKVYFDFANQQITDSFSPLIGKQYAPFFASMISYGILLLPLIIVILLFDHIKALFSLQKVLLFINIYLAAYFATLWLASFIIGLEPMSFFYLNSLSSYLSLQLLQAAGYVVYLILQTGNVIYSCATDMLVGKATSCLQWVVAVAIGLHYYVTVFHPAVASKPPHTSWKFYAIYSSAFFILCMFARIRWVKKQYVTPGDNVADKKS